MKQKCDNCNGWLEYTDTFLNKDLIKCDVYVCIDCGKEYWFEVEDRKEKIKWVTER